MLSHWVTKEYVLITPNDGLRYRLCDGGRRPLHTYTYFGIRSRETTFEAIGDALVVDWASWGRQARGYTAQHALDGSPNCMDGILQARITVYVEAAPCPTALT